MESKHIIVVEDEKNTRYTLELLLKRAGHRVTTIDDGLKAFDSIVELTNRSEPIDLVVLDIQLPGLTGLELIDELMSLDVSLPILVITGCGYHNMEDDLKSKGCVGYLEKPLTSEDVLTNINTLLEPEGTLQ